MDIAVADKEAEIAAYEAAANKKSADIQSAIDTTVVYCSNSFKSLQFLLLKSLSL